MGTKIGVVMVAYNNAEAIRRLFESAVSYSYDIEYHLFLHSQQADVVATCEEITQTTPSPDPLPRKQGRGDKTLRYYAYGENRGLARSWNEGMLAAFEGGCECVIIVNDDVEFATGDLDTLADWAIQNPQYYAVSAWGWHEKNNAEQDMGFSCFALNRVALGKLGCFDENLFPIYFEDCDYAYRAQRLGLEMGRCSLTRVTHGGSASIVETDAELMAQHVLTFTRNKEYYLRKWCGLPGEEEYDFPFGESAYGFRIAPENRHAPYKLTFDRIDQEIVKR